MPMTGSAFAVEKRNSGAEWEMDSKPTKAQGAIATMVSTPVTGDLPGAKAGARELSPPSSFEKTDTEQTRTPPKSSRAITICTRRAALARRHSREHTTSAPIASSSSPR